jgi:hypothetical protein
MKAFDVQSMTARTRDVVRPQLRPERMPWQLAGALGTRAVAAAHPAVLGQLADQPREGGTENLAHLSLLASRERSVDEFVDYPAFDVEGVRTRSKGSSEERSNRLRLITPRHLLSHHRPRHTPSRHTP